MKCHVCGGQMHETVGDLPFKLDQRRIVIVRDVPFLQCDTCREHMLADPVMAEVERTLAQTDRDAELEIVRFAA